MSEFAGHGWEDLYGGHVDVPDPQERQTFLRSKVGPGLGAAGASQAAIEEWVAKVMSARPLSLRDGCWDRHPVSVTEAEPRQVTMTGPVTVHANLSDAPMEVTGTPLASFGHVTDLGDGFRLAPDAVALVVLEEG